VASSLCHILANSFNILLASKYENIIHNLNTHTLLYQNLASKDTLHKEAKGNCKILFIINPEAGDHSTDWPKEIEAYFSSLNHSIELYFLSSGFTMQLLKEKIGTFNPVKVVAVGGDGTVGLVAECLLQKNIPLGLLPAGSANGLAKELGISEVPQDALHTIIAGTVKKIHVTMINGRLCIHLSDIGFNAYMVKKFQSENIRGIWGYLKATIEAAWSVLFINQMMQVSMTIDNEIIETTAAMIVIANATRYGSGAVINPSGSMEDTLFEVIVVKKISVVEIFKMMVSHTSFNQDKTVVFQTRYLKMLPARKVHFQVDGEYLGKVNEIEAVLMPAAIKIIVPHVK
jgi:diacylglycerol kinase (ATP)